jgi:phosphoribosylaminoimidazole (AIR) synthetase
MIYHEHVTVDFNACTMKVVGAGVGYPNGFSLIRKIIQRKINEKSTGNTFKHMKAFIYLTMGHRHILPHRVVCIGRKPE